MSEHDFCRHLLTAVMADVRKHVPTKDIKKAWAWKEGDYIEFHGPNGFFWYGRGCCLWYAKATGWTRYLQHMGVYK